MKIGLDIHGVLDVNTKFFSQLTEALMYFGWEIHIITGGSLENGDIERHLSKLDIHYTHIFSVYEQPKELFTILSRFALVYLPK